MQLGVLNDLEFSKVSKILGLNKEKKLIKQIQTAFLNEDKESLGLLIEQPEIKNVLTSLELFNFFIFSVTENNIDYVINLYESQQKVNLQYFKQKLKLTLEDRKKNIPYSQAKSPKNVSIKNFFNAFIDGNLNYLEFFLKENPSEEFLLKKHHKEKIVISLHENEIYFNSKSFNFLYKNGFFNNEELCDIFFRDIKYKCRTKEEPNCANKLYCLSTNPELLQIISKKPGIRNGLNDTDRIYHLLTLGNAFSDKFLKNLSLIKEVSSDVILSGLLVCINDYHSFSDDELNFIANRFLKESKNSAIHISNYLLNIDSEQLNLVNKLVALLKANHLTKEPFKDSFLYSIPHFTINTVDKNLISFTDNYQNHENDLDKEIYIKTFNYAQENHIKEKGSKKIFIKNIFSENAPALFIDAILNSISDNIKNINLNLKDEDICNTINTLFINKQNQNNILGIIHYLGDRKKVDNFIDYLAKKEKSEFFTLTIEDRQTSLTKNTSKAIKIKKPLFLLYAALQYGSEELLKRMLKKEEIINCLIKNTDITDNIIYKSEFSDYRKQLLLLAIANFHKENLNLNKDGKITERKRLKI